MSSTFHPTLAPNSDKFSATLWRRPSFLQCPIIPLVSSCPSKIVSKAMEVFSSTTCTFFRPPSIIQFQSRSHIVTAVFHFRVPNSMWVSKFRHNKWPTMGWLKTREVYSLTALEAQSLECRGSSASSEGSREEFCFASSSFQRLLKILGLSQYNSHLSIAFFPVSPHLKISLIKTEISGLLPTPLHYDLIVTQVHLQRPCFQIRSRS